MMDSESNNESTTRFFNAFESNDVLDTLAGLDHTAAWCVFIKDA